MNMRPVLSLVLLVVPARAGNPSDLPLVAPAAVSVEHDLLALVPEPTTYVWQRRGGAEGALLEDCALQVADAVRAARLDEFLFEALSTSGLPEELLAEIKSFRNIFATVFGALPWRQLVHSELLYAETMTPPFAEGLGLPSMLLALRTEPGGGASLEGALAGLLGSLAGLLPVHVRYDIHPERDVDGREVTRYALVMPSDDGGWPLLQIAVRQDTFLLGLGEPYFRQAQRLLHGEQQPRLLDVPRFAAAFAGLPADAPGKSYLDVSRLAGDLEGVLGAHEFHRGLWQGLLNDALDLAGQLDTMASATTYRGDEVVTETLTRFRDEPLPSAVPTTTPRLGPAAPASSDLLAYVPADALSFSMRGDVDLVSAYRYGLERVRERWPRADGFLWAFEVAQAAVDLSIERDVLSWLGCQHVTLSVPSRRRHAAPGETDSVRIFQLRDAEGARKCLARLEAVFQAIGPRALANLRGWLAAQEVPFAPDVVIVPSERGYRTLREIHFSGIPLPFPLPRITFGVVGKLLVLSTSPEAVASCLAVAAEEEPGLREHSLAGALLGRGDLASARLARRGLEVQGAIQMVAALDGLLGQLVGQFAQGSPEGQRVVDFSNGLAQRVAAILGAFDFLDDAVTWSEVRQHGAARYECTVQRLLRPEARPFRRSAPGT